MKKSLLFLFVFLPSLIFAQTLTNSTSINITKTWSQEPSGWTYPIMILLPTTPIPAGGYPVAIVLHGNGGNGNGSIAQWRNTLTNHILIGPSGYRTSWNIADEASDAPDVEMIGDLVDQLQTYSNVNPNKIRLIGSSNGSGLCNRVFIENDDPGIDIICGIVSQLNVPQYHNNNFHFPSGATGDPAPFDGYDTPITPITGRRFLSICNDNDPIIPYLGGSSPVGVDFLDAQEAIFLIAQSQGYTGEKLPAAGTQLGTSTVYEYAYLSNQVVHLRGNARHSASVEQREYVNTYFNTVLEDNDSDNDGVTDDIDCDDNDPNIGAKQTAGTSCDDGDDTTENDQIQADGCSCAGTKIACIDNGGDADEDGVCAEVDCDDNNPNIGAKQTAGTSCDDGDNTTENDQIQADGCSCAGTKIACIDNGGDADKDGICADEDCDDNNPNIGAKQTAGTSCDDGDNTTENDQIQADGCSCAGTKIACIDNGGDADEDGVCADEDCDDNNPNIGAKQTAGTSCDDGDNTTENDQIQADGCSCAGSPINISGCLAPTNPVISGTGGRRVNIDWTAVSGATHYIIQIRFKGTSRWLVTARVNATKVHLYGAFRSYEYRIKSICEDGESVYSPIYEFSIPTVAGLTSATSRNKQVEATEIFLEATASLYPNPVATQLNLFYQTKAKKATFLIYDSQGKIVYERTLSETRANYDINLSNLETGFYFGVVKETGKVPFYEKFIKQ